MGILLSGLIGALIATLLSILYHQISEQKKIRGDALMDIVSYCDDVYTHLNQIHGHKQFKYLKKGTILNNDEYRIINRELTLLLVSSKPGVKLALAYGEGKTMAIFNKLRTYFLKVASKLREPTMDEWDKRSKEIFSIFSSEIDPLRINLERSLLNESKAIEIIIENFKSFSDHLMKKINA
jgi:hypothetical protein